MAASLWWDEDETNNKLRAENKLDDLLVFGYACKLFRDDSKARAIENGKLLIPWMGDEKLMIDRYDGRGHLYDLASHDADNIEDKDPKLTEEEQAVETACDEERYLELHTNLQETQLYEEEEWKRYYLSLQEGYQAVEFSYEQPTGGEDGDQHQHVTEIIQENEKPFVVAADLHVPPDMLTPTCSKENARIEKTASFIAQHGIQMEIMLKTKQASNTQFDFLHFDHSLNPYYKHVVHMIKSGKYRPLQEEEEEEHKKEEDYLHPSLSSSSSQLPPPLPPPVSKPIELPKVCIHDTPYGALIQSIRKNTQTPASLTSGQIVPPLMPSYISDLQIAGSPASLTSGQICPPLLPPYVSDPHIAGSPAPPGTEMVTLPLASCVNGQLMAGNGLGSEGHGQLVADAGLGSQDYSQQVHHRRRRSSSSDSSSSSSSSSSASSSSSSHSSHSSGTRRKPHHRNKPAPNKVEGPAPVLPPPPDMQAIIDRMAMYVVKNGVEFEMVVMNRNDQRFQFLHEHHEYFPYYTFIKDTYLQELMKTRTEAEKDEKLGNNSSNSQRSVSFSIKSRPREQENGQPSGKVRLFEYDSSDDGEGQADREIQVQSGTATPTPRDTQTHSGPTPGLKPAADEEFQKEMEEKLKDKLASAVKERISQSNKEKQLQMERKKKAAAFLTFLKSSLTVVPPGHGQDSSTTCDTQQEETAAAMTVPTFDSNNQSKTQLLLKKEKTSKSSKGKKRSHRSPTPPSAYSFNRRSPSRQSPFQRTDRPTFRERTPPWQRRHRETVTSHKRSRSRSLPRKDEKKKKHRLSKSKSPARQDRSKERSRRHGKEKSRQKSKEKKKKEKSRTKSKDEENSRHRQSRPDNEVEFQDKHKAAASLLAPSSSQESIPCQRLPHSESIDEQVASSSRGSSHYNSPSTRPNSQSRGSTPSRVTTDTTSKDLMSKVRAMLKKSREQTFSQEDT